MADVSPDCKRLLEVDADIRALTHIISKISRDSSRAPDPRRAFEFLNRPTRGPDVRLAVATYIANITTRGNGDIRTPGGQTSTCTPSAMQSVAVVLNYPNLLVTSEAIPDPTSVSTSTTSASVKRLYPSDKKLGDLARSTDLELDISLEEHLTDVLAAISDVNFHLFIIRRCLLATKHRVEMDKYIFVRLDSRPEDDPIRAFSGSGKEIRLEDVLNVVHSEWESNMTATAESESGPHAKDADASQWYRVFGDMPGVPSRGEESSREFEWNLVTGRDWIQRLAKVLRRIRELTAEGGEESHTMENESIVTLTGAIAILTSFLRLPLAKMFDIPPIKIVLDRYAFASWSGRAKHHDIPRQDQYMDHRAQDGESALSLTLRYLKSIVAGFQASHHISAMSRRHSPGRLHVGLAEIHPATIPVKDFPFESLFRKAFWIKGNSPKADAKFKDKMTRLSEILKMDLEELRSPAAFNGTIHPEAALMGLIYADKAAYNGLLNKDGVCRIGTGRKPCWCCHRLAEELDSGWNRADERVKVKLHTPVSHGIITPWILPAGIPLHIAEKLRNALRAQLTQALPYQIRPSEYDDVSDDDCVSQ